MPRRSLSLVTAAVIGLAASQASAADLSKKSSSLRTAGTTANNLDRMLHRRQRRRSISTPVGGFRFFWIS